MRPRNIWLGLALLGLVLVAIANAHLVYVAVTSQPECVDHRKSVGGDGRYRAAKPAC
jgi:hypothetical protein